MGREDFERRVCAFCGDRLGVYEPIVALSDADVRRTSRAREPGLLDGGATMTHWPCGLVEPLYVGAE
jgi:hypothetical protein